MIEQTLEQLDHGDRELLEAASVAGKEFSVLTVAAGSRRTEEDIEQRCEALARDGRLIQRPMRQSGRMGPLARYVFSHDLYQEALYREFRRAAAGGYREIGERLQDVHGIA